MNFLFLDRINNFERYNLSMEGTLCSGVSSSVPPFSDEMVSSEGVEVVPPLVLVVSKDFSHNKKSRSSLSGPGTADKESKSRVWALCQ